jgi:hypothetical protein
MLPGKIWNAAKGWRAYRGDFVRKRWYALWLGCAIGSLLGIGQRLMTGPSTKSLAALQAYKAQLVILCATIAAIGLPPTLLWFRRFVRSWWAGITSVLAFFAACATFGALNFGPAYPKLTSAVSLGLVGAVLVAEFWKHQGRPSPVPLADLRLNIPTKKADLSAGLRWEAPIGDDPITNWADDIVGRTAIVELLADHALRLQTPIVALHGGLGDGKSSVLNLLRNAVEGKAVVVSFSAWLPGSETTLAADLFKDIATECRKLVYVPQLRKRALAFARTVSGSVSYLGGLKELTPAQSQRDEILELHNSLRRVPMPILVLLDEIDRMQADELVVLLKILRGVASIPERNIRMRVQPRGD